VPRFRVCFFLSRLGKHGHKATTPFDSCLPGCAELPLRIFLQLPLRAPISASHVLPCGWPVAPTCTAVPFVVATLHCEDGELFFPRPWQSLHRSPVENLAVTGLQGHGRKAMSRIAFLTHCPVPTLPHTGHAPSQGSSKYSKAAKYLPSGGRTTQRTTEK
jgi:hypothetical protein